MAVFDQRGQKVAGDQHNAGRDMIIHREQEHSSIPGTKRVPFSKKLQQTHLSDKNRQQQKTHSVLFCYAREDEHLLNQLKNHLASLQRQGILTIWYDRQISPGERWEQELHAHLNTADIILLLISPDFMASDYCYSIEMKQALRRHEQGEATVVPIILRPVHWQGALPGTLQALPTDAQPVINSSARTIDEAFLDVTEGICRIVEHGALR